MRGLSGGQAERSSASAWLECRWESAGWKHNENALIALPEGAWVTRKGELQKAQIIVTLLLDHGIDVNTHGGRRGSALAAAAYSRNVMMTKLLLGRGANPHA